VQSHLTSLQRRHLQFCKLTGCRIQPRQVEQPKIISVFSVTADPLVVVDKITTAIQDQFPSIDLERSGMVRGMSVDKIDSAVNELMCKARLFGLDAITPVGAPVCRDNHYVAGLSYLAYSAAQFIGERLCEGG